MSTTLEVALFLSMNGRAREAIEFYKLHLHAEERLRVSYEDMAQRDSSLQLTDDNRHWIIHSVLTIGKTKLMLAEDTTDVSEKYTVGNHISICVQSADLQEIEGFYRSLTTDARVRIIVPLASKIFSKAYGVVEDPFGVQIQLMYDDRLQ
jgi:Uncharacterized protein conserved in bacteria